MNVINELYCNTIDAPSGFPELGLNRPSEKEREHEDKVYNKLKGLISKETHDKVVELQSELCAVCEERGFTAGFKLGVMLMVEVFRHE